MEAVTSISPIPTLIKIAEDEILNVHYTVNIVDLGEVRVYQTATGHWYQVYSGERKRDDEQSIRCVQVNFSDREEPEYYYGKKAENIWKWYVSMVITDLTLDNNS